MTDATIFFHITVSLDIRIHMSCHVSHHMSLGRTQSDT